MNRQAFLAALRKGLSGLPQEDIDRSVEYYGEMIDDRMEDGLTEEEATAAVGSVHEIISQIQAETSLPKANPPAVKPRRTRKTWEIALLILGAPLWLPLLLAAAILVVAVFIIIWSVVIVLYAIDLTFSAGGVAGICGSLTYFLSGNAAPGILFIGAGLVCAGLAILLFFGANQAARGTIILGKQIFLRIRACFIRKGAVQ